MSHIILDNSVRYRWGRGSELVVEGDTVRLHLGVLGAFYYHRQALHCRLYGRSSLYRRLNRRRIARLWADD